MAKSSKAIELKYQRGLTAIARAVGAIVKAFPDPLNPKLTETLERYALALGPWAEAFAAQMILESTKTIDKTFAKSKKISQQLKNNVIPQYKVRELMNEQVTLIKSLPIKSGLRAQEIALNTLQGGLRSEQAAIEIAKTTGITIRRAKTIARTEVARTNAVLTEARAQNVGITHYIWNTSGDADVRESHAEMDGQVIAYDSPPTLSDGTKGHAGTFPNCRCFQEPIIPE